MKRKPTGVRYGGNAGVLEIHVRKQIIVRTKTGFSHCQHRKFNEPAKVR